MRETKQAFFFSQADEKGSSGFSFHRDSLQESLDDSISSLAQTDQVMAGGSLSILRRKKDAG